MRPYSRRLQLVFLTLACFGLHACGETSPVVGPGSVGTTGQTPAPTPTPVPTRTPLSRPVVAGALTPPPGKIYFGAYVNTSGLQGGDTPTAIAALENDLGRPLALHMEYTVFGENLNGNAQKDDFAHYRVPVVSIACSATNAQIASGQYDATIDLMASEVKLYGWPVFIRYDWDPNLPAGVLQSTSCWDPNTDEKNHVFSPTEYIAAWKHVHDRFTSVDGVTNAVWVWSVSSSSLAVDSLQYYPGNAEVDWVGMDDYDTNDTDFAATFSALYSELAPIGKPIMIGETGALPGEQAPFFGAGAGALQSSFPQVSAFLYYDGINYTQGENEDWRITASAFPNFSSFATSSYVSYIYGE
jgi:hypothetical protein